MPLPTLKPQEIPFDSPESCNTFIPSARKPFLATPAALKAYGEQIGPCLYQLQALAVLHDGLDYLQVFTDPSKPEALWFIEGGEGGAITALLPSDY
ncbi:MAG: hypothetical protein ABSF26_15150 [Thermoguttaceae bacterium]|jgi:hypothetical protein